MFRYIEDPVHGWLEVPANLIFDLGVEECISGYSYMDCNNLDPVNFDVLPTNEFGGFFGFKQHERKFPVLPRLALTLTSQRF